MNDLMIYTEASKKLSKLKSLMKKKDFSDLKEIGFDLLIPTFDYECNYSHLMYGTLGRDIEGVRNHQKKVDKKSIKTVLENYNQLSVTDKYIYETAAKDTAKYFMEQFYGKIKTKSFRLAIIKDERVIANLSKYNLSSENEEEAEMAAKQLIIDIVSERVLFDLLATYGEDQEYEVSLNSLEDVRIQDALATYGLMQIQSSLVGNPICIRISLREYITSLMSGYNQKRVRTKVEEEN